jgi:hypothetical protein
MWVENVLVVGNQIVDVAELDGWQLTIGAGDETRPHLLLAHFTLTEGASNHASTAR